ncbi:MAG: molecular chaperone GrpE [Acidimicrobiaceae bacterium]
MSDAVPTDDDGELGDELIFDVPDDASELLADEVTADLDELSEVARERNEYLALAQRLQAEFENFRKRSAKERADAEANGAGRLAGKLLDVLDACDAALIHGVEGIAPIYTALIEALRKEGLEVIAADDQPFDPNLHEAVMHEPGDSDEPTVSESLRTGYLWHGKVLRPAMVKVRG